MEINHLEDATTQKAEQNIKQAPYAEHGAPIDHVTSHPPYPPAGPNLRWSRVRDYLRDPFSEFFGTFILIMFGDGGVAQVVLSKYKEGSYQSISWAWGYVNDHLFNTFITVKPLSFLK